MPATSNYRHSLLLDLFPPIQPYSTGFLDVDETHSLYWEQSGNPAGVPVVLLHGGPGAGATPTHRRFFDPDYYRIIVFDQRGAGRSHPLGSVENNSLQHLIADMEKLRTKLNVEAWHLFGGSWGSTLALAYAQTHPKRCLGMVLRGIFLLEQAEVDWFMYGMHAVFPEAWEQLAAAIPENRRNDLVNAFYEILTGDNYDQKMNAAIRWNLYEEACSSLMPNYQTITTEEQKAYALALARIEAHYFKHGVISAENSLMKGIDKIRSIPSTIINGRYDIICPIHTAYKLHVEWPEADYIVVPDGGHSALDPPVRSRLIEATENMKTIR